MDERREEHANLGTPAGRSAIADHLRRNASRKRKTPGSQSTAGPDEADSRKSALGGRNPYSYKHNDDPPADHDRRCLATRDFGNNGDTDDCENQ